MSTLVQKPMSAMEKQKLAVDTTAHAKIPGCVAGGLLYI
uniref:Uncharacterized protein n=1 Tax=virus sp. ctLTC15 TaxID=2826801 RepID=A0A8S5R7V3_9VIRU|nr:MAG TPA: hypothetical protein [virus sp. ctLTC15]